MSVGSTPIRATREQQLASVGHWQASLAVNQPSERTLAVQLRPGALQQRFVHGAVRCWFCSEAFNLANAGSIPVRVAVLARCDVGFTVRPSTWPTRVRFPSESLDAAKWWNLVDTRRSEGRARRGVRVQVSPWLLTERLQVGRDPTGFHTAGVPGSIPGPATCGWASAHSGLISLDCRCATPGPAT